MKQTTLDIMLYNQITILLLLIFSFVHTHAAKPTFERVSTLNSHLSNSITTITQDNTGFLWLGTEYGLTRFDGYSYVSFYANEENESSIPNNNINRIIKTQNGNIWIGTDRGIAYVELPSGRIIRPKYCSQFDDLKINTICEDLEGNLWLGTNDGVKVINPELETTISFSTALFEGQNSFNVNFIDIDNNGNIWIGSNFGFSAVKRVPTEKLFQSGDIDERLWEEKNNLGYFLIDASNRLWINSNDKNCTYDITFDRLLTNKTEIKAKIDGKCILLLKNNHLLIGSRWNGITELRGNDKGIFTAHAQFWMNSNSTTDLSNTINTIFEDKAGNIWAGTKMGFYVQRKISPSLFNNIRADENDNYTLSHNSISSILQAKDNKLWIGTSNGLNQLQLENGKIPANPSFKSYIKRETSHSEMAVQCLTEDMNHQLWVGTKQGLVFFDPQREVFYKRDDIEEFINKNNITLTKTLYRDMLNNIWIGFSYGGLVVYSSDKDELTQIENFSKKDIWSIAKDQVGNMWIGTRNGLFRFNTNMLLSQIPLNTREYKYNDKSKESIPANWITAIEVASNGDVWIGTSEGLCKFNPTTGNFDRIDLSVNNHPPYVSSITEDLKGRIWISTTSGIFRKEDTSVEYFELTADDFSSINYTFGHLLTEKGDIVLGGTSGLIYFNPDKITPDSTKQNIYFSQLLFPDQNLKNKNIDINERSEITLSHREKQFSVLFSTLNYAHTSRIKFSYRIKELSDDWIYLGNMNNISFSNLQKGKYTLEVRSTTTAGLWQKDSRILKITVLPAWWKTTWAYIIYVISSTLLLYLVLRWFRIKEHLQHMNEFNQFKLTFYTNLLHSFKSPLTLMQAPLNALLRNHRSMTSNEISEMLTFIQRNTKRLSHMMMQLLEVIKVDKGKLTLHQTNNDIIALLRDIFESFSEIADSKQINFTFHTNLESLVLTFDFEKIEIVLFNLLSNAFKFTEKGGNIQLNAEISALEENFNISISDTGIGVASENKKKIFERFWQVYNEDQTQIKDIGIGIGLSLANDFIKAHGGFIKVESKLNKGSCFTVSLPMSNIYLNNQAPPEHEQYPTRKAENVAFYIEIEKELSIDESDEQEAVQKQEIIYLLSDDKEILNFLHTTLSKKFHVFKFDKEEKIIEKVRDSSPSLIISKIVLRGKQSGLDLCRQMKEDTSKSHIPYILLAENSDESEKLVAYEAGADAYIERPIDINLLFARINHILSMQNKIKEKTHQEIITNPKKVSSTSRDTQFLQDVMSVVEGKINDERFTLDDFAASMNMSRSTLNSKMKLLTQQTPIEFVQNVRLKRAVQLLKLNAYSISDISDMVGISDPRYFSTIFKKLYGVSPRQYSQIEKDKNSLKQE